MIFDGGKVRMLKVPNNDLWANFEELYQIGVIPRVTYSSTGVRMIHIATNEIDA
jgi:hypothetical protein